MRGGQNLARGPGFADRRLTMVDMECVKSRVKIPVAALRRYIDIIIFIIGMSFFQPIIAWCGFLPRNIRNLVIIINYYHLRGKHYKLFVFPKH